MTALRDHRETLRRCLDCGKRLAHKQVQELWKFKPKWKTCAACRKKERERKANAKIGDALQRMLPEQDAAVAAGQCESGAVRPAIREDGNDLGHPTEL